MSISLNDIYKTNNKFRTQIIDGKYIYEFSDSEPLYPSFSKLKSLFCKHESTIHNFKVYQRQHDGSNLYSIHRVCTKCGKRF